MVGSNGEVANSNSVDPNNPESSTVNHEEPDLAVDDIIIQTPFQTVDKAIDAEVVSTHTHTHLRPASVNYRVSIAHILCSFL